jgi:cbb3-type cytochrome oxidase maturation protein
MMPWGMWVVVGWMALVSFTALLLFVWGCEHGQFDDIEEAKYKMLEDKEPEPWPGRKGGST